MAALLVPGHRASTADKPGPSARATTTGSPGTAEFTSYQGGVNSLAYSPDGTTLAGGMADGSVWL